MFMIAKVKDAAGKEHLVEVVETFPGSGKPVTMGEVIADPSLLRDPEMEKLVRGFLAESPDGMMLGSFINMVRSEREARRELAQRTDQQLIEEYVGLDNFLEEQVCSSDLARLHALEDVMGERGITREAVDAERARVKERAVLWILREAESQGWPQMEINPGVVIQSGQESWEKWAVDGNDLTAVGYALAERKRS